ncbi:MAG TPA: glycosyltransferase family 39 protein [Phycisphaerae bacterium]|nr:glycosyltransferase family 39 protein [Phycisphaerae bacterium]
MYDLNPPANPSSSPAPAGAALAPPAAAQPIFPVMDSQRGAWIAGVLLILILAFYAFVLSAFYEPAHPGVDQNGYMATARYIVENHRINTVVQDPLQFVGRMMIQTPDGKIYAKYPPGVGALGAVLRLLFDPSATYLVDPLCAVVALFFAYLLFRRMLDPFLSLIGVIWLAFNPITMLYADDANSHGAALCFTVIGFWGLLSWWQKGGVWRGIIGGLALGFCASIRYTEFLWSIPLLFVLLIQWRSARRHILECFAVGAAFALPIGALAVLNWVSFGAPWRTGYYFCGEQTGFAWSYLFSGTSGGPGDQGNWQTFIEQFESIGLFLLFPLALAGLVRLYWSHWKLALALSLWVVPSVTVYLFYYWDPDNDFNTGYLRFFLDVFPALIMVAIWFLSRAAGAGGAARAVTVGLLTMLGVGYGSYIIAPRMLAQQAGKLAMLQTSRVIQDNIKPGSVIFADEQTCNYLDTLGGYTLYSTALFTPGTIDRFAMVADHVGPISLQKARADVYEKLLGYFLPNGGWESKTLVELHNMELNIAARAWADHKEVYYLVPASQIWPIVPRTAYTQIDRLAVWTPVQAAASMQITMQRRQPQMQGFGQRGGGRFQGAQGLLQRGQFQGNMILVELKPTDSGASAAVTHKPVSPHS